MTDLSRLREVAEKAQEKNATVIAGPGAWLVSDHGLWVAHLAKNMERRFKKAREESNQ